MAAHFIEPRWLHRQLVHGSEAVSPDPSLPREEGGRAASSLAISAPLVRRLFGAADSLGRVWAVGCVHQPPAIPPQRYEDRNHPSGSPHGVFSFSPLEALMSPPWSPGTVLESTSLFLLVEFPGSCL